MTSLKQGVHATVSKKQLALVRQAVDANGLEALEKPGRLNETWRDVKARGFLHGKTLFFQCARKLYPNIYRVEVKLRWSQAEKDCLADGLRNGQTPKSMFDAGLFPGRSLAATEDQAKVQRGASQPVNGRQVKKRVQKSIRWTQAEKDRLADGLRNGQMPISMFDAGLFPGRSLAATETQASAQRKAIVLLQAQRKAAVLL